MNSFNLSTALLHWLPLLTNLTESRIFTYLCLLAAETPDHKIGKSIQEIADITHLAWRTVQEKLQTLAARGAIRILSVDKERTLLEIPLQYRSAPVNPVKPVIQPPASIPELIFRLTGQRPSAQHLADMKTAAADDAPRLQRCLDSFLQEGKGWETFELLTVAVQDHFRPRRYY